MAEKPDKSYIPTSDGKIALKDSLMTDIKNMQLDKMDWEELLITMTIYESIAGIKPTQQFTKQASVYDNMSKLKK